MGHTLVASFDRDFTTFLHGVLDRVDANKIPYGRQQCDRLLANRKFEYHMTLAHWGKQEDPIYMPRIPMIAFPQFSMEVTKSEICAAQENSWLLYYPLEPGSRYSEALYGVCSALGTNIMPYPHISLAVSKDLSQLQQIKRTLDSSCHYPFIINAEALDLYHIWQPVRKVCRLYCLDEF